MIEDNVLNEPSDRMILLIGGKHDGERFHYVGGSVLEIDDECYQTDIMESVVSKNPLLLLRILYARIDSMKRSDALWALFDGYRKQSK